MWIINKLKLIFFILSLFLLNLSFSANLNIQNDLITDILRLTPQDSPPECSSSFKGRLYYKSSDKQIYYCNGTNWQILGKGGKDTAIGSAIVASSSADALRADFACDGTDDQEEIQQAIDYLSNAGGAVYLLEGTYNLSDKILFDNGSSDGIDDSNKALIGTGAGTVLNLSTNNAAQSSDASRIALSQLRIKYNGEDGCCFENINYSLLEKLWFEGHGIKLAKSNFNIIGENFYSPPDNSIIPPLLLVGDCWEEIGEGSSYNIIHNNIFTTATGWYNPNSLPGTIGIYCNSSDNIAIGNIMENDSEDDEGIFIFAKSSRNIIVGNRILSEEHGIISWGNYQENIFNSNIIGSISKGVGTGIGILLLNEGDYENPHLINSNLISTPLDGIASCAFNSLLVGNILYNIAGEFGIIISKTTLISSNYLFSSAEEVYGIVTTNDAVSKNSYLVGNFIELSDYSQPISDAGENTRYTDKIKISLEPGEYTGLKNGETLTPQGPTSYLRLTPSSNINLGNPNIASGKTEGDILIIENAASGNYYVRFKDGQGVKLEDSILVGGKLDLYPGDILVFVWNGSHWVEIGYSDN